MGMKIEKLIPYASEAKFSDDRTATPTSSTDVFARKEKPRVVTFRGKRSKKRGMR